MQNRFLVQSFLTLLLSSFFIGQILSKPPATADEIFGLTKAHKVRVTISREEWDVLQTSNGRGGASGLGGTDYRQPDGRLVHVGSGFRGYFPWARADLRLNGIEIRNAGLRYKGNFSFTQSSAANPFRANFKAKTDLFGGKANWNGVETLNFHAGILDPSLMREAVAFALFRAAGVPAPRTAYADLTFEVPGLHANADAGRYVLIENVNRQFLNHALLRSGGLLLKPEGLRGGIQAMGSSWDSYIPAYRPDRDATPHEQERVMAFARLVSQSDIALFRSEISSYLDVDEFLRFVAVNAFIVNTDSYLNGTHNFYLYLDPEDDKFRFIPWDQDLSMGNRGSSAFDMLRPASPNQRLVSLLLDDPAVAEQYRRILKELSVAAFATSAIRKTLDEIEPMSLNLNASPRNFLETRAATLQSLVSQWEKEP